MARGNRPVAVRLSEAERARWQSAADASGLSLSEFVRKSVTAMLGLAEADRAAAYACEHEYRAAGARLGRVEFDPAVTLREGDSAKFTVTVNDWGDEWPSEPSATQAEVDAILADGEAPT